MTDYNSIMEELLKPTAQEEPEPDEDETSIYTSTDDGYYHRDDEEEFEYAQEYNEWSEDMYAMDDDYISRVRQAITNLEEALDRMDTSDHRYWPDDIDTMEELIRDIEDNTDTLCCKAEDYRSDPREW